MKPGLTGNFDREFDRQRDSPSVGEPFGRAWIYLVVPDPEDRRVGSGSATIPAQGVFRDQEAEWPERVC